MTNQPDSSDDLIAELAKLMATNAKGDASGNKAQTSPASSTPSPALQGLAGNGAKPAVRIPGLDMPPLSVVPIESTAKADSKPSTFDFKPMAPMPSQAKPGTTVPTIRIPGMDQPVPTPQVAAPAPQPAAPPPQAAAPQPKPAAPAVVSPVSTRPGPLVSAPEIKHVERTVPPVTPVRATTTPQRVEPKRVEPQIVAPAPPPPAPASEAGKPAARAETRHESANTNSGGKPRDQKPAFDPIAEIIAANLDDAERDKPVTPMAKPVQVSATATKPATVTPVVPLNPRPAQQGPAKLSPAAPITLKPAFGARPVPPENDKFFVAPVFGVSTKAGPPISSPPAPAAEAKPVPVPTRRPGDPMDEIETLIGEAVRVDAEADDDEPIDRPEPPKPVVPPLTTNFAPRRSGLKDDPDTNPQSAEAAILAAVAASGSDVGRVDPVAGDESARRKSKYKPKPARRPSSGARQYVGLAVAGTLLVAAGLSLYWVLGMGRGDPADAPLLTADASPVKEVPAVVASTEPRSPVLDEIDGVDAAPGGETLVSRDDTEGESPTEVAAVPEVAETGLANRKVRTVTVRPDGTIVESESSVAGAEALPVDRPDVPEVPGESLEPSELLEAAAQTVVVDPIAAVIAETITATAPGAAEDVAAADPGAAPGAEAVPEAPLAVAAAETPNQVTALALLPEGATATPPDVVAPTPMSRPLNRELLNGQPSRSVTAAVDTNNGGLALTAGGQQIDLLAAQPTPQPQQVAVATPEPASSSAAAYVQLSAQPSEDAARSTARTLSSRFSSLFGGAEAEIHRVDLGAKGIWYRVLVPASSRASANSMCLDIKNAGGDCILR
jgi:hypothetical protein